MFSFVQSIIPKDSKFIQVCYHSRVQFTSNLVFLTNLKDFENAKEEKELLQMFFKGQDQGFAHIKRRKKEAEKYPP